MSSTQMTKAEESTAISLLILLVEQTCTAWQNHLQEYQKACRTVILQRLLQAQRCAQRKKLHSCIILMLHGNMLYSRQPRFFRCIQIPWHRRESGRQKMMLKSLILHTRCSRAFLFQETQLTAGMLTITQRFQQNRTATCSSSSTQ